MEPSREQLTETAIEYQKQRLVFSKPLAVRIRCGESKITLESSIGISGSGSDFESTWEVLRMEIFKRWNDPVLRAKHFPSHTVDREETVSSAMNLARLASRRY